ncbi:MAG: DMT family transporter [Pseudomonadota bacterium]
MIRPPNLSPNVRGALYGLAAFAAFSTHDVFVKELGATYSPFQIVFFSALMSFPLISLVLIGNDRPGTLRPVHPWWVALRSLCAAVTATSAFYAFSQLPLSQVYAFIFAAPLLITVLAIPMLGETVRLRRGLAVLAGFVGVLIVLNPGATPLSPGHLAALAAAFAGAMNAIIVRKIGNEERGVVMVLYPMLTNLGFTAAALPFVYVDVPLEHLGMFAVTSALGLLAMGFLVLAYKHGQALVVAPMQYSQIVWATFYGILLFQEYPDRLTIIGTAVIVVSGVFILRREATGDVSRNTPVLSSRTRIGQAIGLRVGNFLDRDRDRPDA